MGDGSTASPAAEPVAPSSIKLQGGLQEFSDQPPGGTKQCKLIKMKPLLDFSDKRLKAAAKTSRRRLQGRAQHTGNPGGKLVSQTPTPAPTQPQTGHADGGPPLTATLYDPNNPHLGDWVPPGQRKNLPPGEGITPGGYLYPLEASQPDWQDDLFIAGFFGSWLVNLFRAPLVPLLPRPVVTPNQPAEEEYVWVSITKTGKIIWHEGETYYRNTIRGYRTTLSKALTDGARPKLPGYYRAGGR